MTQVLSLNAAEGAVAVMVSDEIFQSLFPGDKGGLEHIVQEVNFGTDALGFGIGQVGVYVDKDFAGLVQFLHHDVQVVGQNGEAAHDDQTGHRNTHSGEGHKSMEENTPEAFFQQISQIIQLHRRFPPLFRPGLPGPRQWR